ncbi:hypothetical protein Tco_1243725 [Tanacetum coccineum]
MKIYKPTNNNLGTSSNTMNKNVDTSPRARNDRKTRQFVNQRIMTFAGNRETVGNQVKVYEYHKEKMMMQERIKSAKNILRTQTCTLTKDELSQFITAYSIPFEYKVMLPKKYFNVHVSRLNPFGCAKITTFAVMCKAYGGEPMVEIFKGLFNLYPGGQWLTFAKRQDKHVPNLLPKLITQIGNWKGRFFFVQDFIVPSDCPELLSKDNRWDMRSFKDKIPPSIHENPFYQRLSWYPVNVRTFLDPILFLAGVKPS